MNLADARVLIMSDGRVGHENQARGVAAALGFPDPEILTLKRAYPQRWLGWLPPQWLYRNWHVVAGAAAQAQLLIAAGRGPTKALAVLKKSLPQLFTVALLRPGGKFSSYDVVSAPLHDGIAAAPNFITSLGNLNLITSERLALEGQRWAKRLNHVRGFKLAVLLGGPSKHGGLAEDAVGPMIEALATTLKANHSEDAGLLVTTSRRTTPKMRTDLEAALKASGLGYFLWHPDDATARDNPYFAFLHHANAVVVSADSTSMVSEACTAGKPVYVWGEAKSLPRKFQQLYQSLMQQGRLVYFAGNLQLRAPAAPLLDTPLVAGFIRARWQRRFGAKA